MIPSGGRVRLFCGREGGNMNSNKKAKARKAALAAAQAKKTAQAKQILTVGVGAWA